jgi:predicted TIM-barrel fold metal-dependent hydrolase
VAAHEIAGLGLRGVMMPGLPGVEDYDAAIYDPFWEAAVGLGLPLSFHILTTPSEHTRGPNLLVFGGVFERHPGLRVVCVEADAGWVPHFMYRMDHAYNRHRHWMAPGTELGRLPSEYFAENISVTFQDDWTAFRFADAMNWRRVMWGNDFPHSDSTWPWSQKLLDEQTVQLEPEQARAILSTNVAELYRLDLSTLTG